MANNKTYPTGCGIYTIHMPLCDKYYVGKSVDIYNRMKVHKCDLKMGRHARRELQEYYNNFGWDSLKISVATHCKPEELDFEEQKISVAMNAIGHNIINNRIHTIVDNIAVPRHIVKHIDALIKLVDTGSLSVSELCDFIELKERQMSEKFDY